MPHEPKWKKACQSIHTVLFTVAIISFITHLSCLVIAWNNSSLTPTALQSEYIPRGWYVTPVVEQRMEFIQTVSIVTMSLAFSTIFIFHFLLGVKIIQDAPSLWRWLQERKAKKEYGEIGKLILLLAIIVFLLKVLL